MAIEQRAVQRGRTFDPGHFCRCHDRQETADRRAHRLHLHRAPHLAQWRAHHLCKIDLPGRPSPLHRAFQPVIFRLRFALTGQYRGSTPPPTPFVERDECYDAVREAFAPAAGVVDPS
ncbi:hypothetical protein CHELA40_50392 [Chelatococcus asaccharovorans]|nr:hypothetical protein CHELA17_20357 [Chelatococcus asaccharovorans]CAH1692648.1 hypothetical protein CHELA40_50392 [Chelatococcus asaccharovorans]